MISLSLLALILIGVSLSLWALLRRARLQQAGLLRVGLQAMLQFAIWLCVWWLWQPPHWLPAAQEASIPFTADQPMFRRALIDHAPQRLTLSSADDNPSWQVDWPRQLTLGDSLNLSLSNLDSLPAETRLTLIGPDGNTVDAHNLDGDALARIAAADNRITLRHVPAQAGAQLFQLEIDTGASRRREPVPVQVLEPSAPQTLLWTAGPTFETAALQRWLRQSGTPATVVTQLAPGLARRLKLNDGRAAGENPLAGEPFDQVILDSRLWPTLDAQQKAALARQPAVLWLVDRDTPESFLQAQATNGLALAPLAKPSVVEMDVEQNLPPLISRGFQPRSTRAADAQIRASSGDVLYWGRALEDGTRGFVLFDRSYRWITAGGGPEYAALWKRVSDLQLAQQGAAPPLRADTPLARTGHALTLCSPALLQASALQVAELARPDAPLSLLTAADRPCATTWPLAAGWHRLEGTKTPGDFYVFEESAWPWWQQALRERDTAQMAMARLGPSVQTQDRTALPRAWIAVMLLLLLTASWLMERRTAH